MVLLQKQGDKRTSRVSDMYIGRTRWTATESETHSRAPSLEPSLERVSRDVGGRVSLLDHEFVVRGSSSKTLSPDETSGGEVDCERRQRTRGVSN